MLTHPSRQGFCSLPTFATGVFTVEMKWSTGMPRWTAAACSATPSAADSVSAGRTTGSWNTSATICSRQTGRLQLQRRPHHCQCCRFCTACRCTTSRTCCHSRFLDPPPHRRSSAAAAPCCFNSTMPAQPHRCQQLGGADGWHRQAARWLAACAPHPHLHTGRRWRPPALHGTAARAAATCSPLHEGRRSGITQNEHRDRTCHPLELTLD